MSDSPPPSLDGRVALVTGGGSGIGAALCGRLAERGATVVVADVDNAGAQTVAEALSGLALHLDVRDREAWDEAAATVVERYGRLDLVALNAGTMSRPHGTPSTDDPLHWFAERYELVRSVNLDGVAYGVLATLPHLRATGGGAIVATASLVGLRPLEIDPVYSMTKHGVVGLVRSLAPTLAAHGVSIGAVCPGGVDTPMASDTPTHGVERATPDHIAACLEAVLDSPVDDTGKIWLAFAGRPMWEYQFNSTKPPT